MERRRLLDGLVGAAVAVLVLVLVGVVGFLVLSEPAGRADGPSPRPTADGGPGELAGDAPSAPTDLSDGEVWMGDVALEAGSLATADGLLHDVQAERAWTSGPARPG